MIDDLDYRVAAERQEMIYDEEREEYQSIIRALTELVAILEGEQARADAQAATIEALLARVAKADELADQAQHVCNVLKDDNGHAPIRLDQALAAYRATATDTGAA
jgi:hypothetical protein